MENIEIQKIKGLYNKFEKELSKDPKKTNTFSNKLLEISIQIVEEIDNIFDGRKDTEDRSEDYKIEVISRLGKIYKIDGLDILSVDEMLNKIVKKIENILLLNTIKLGYDIFPAQNGKKILKWSENKNFEKEKQSVDKFGILVQLLLNNKINLDNVTIYEERIDTNRMRGFPYKIIYLKINGTNKTIIISDEIGQATFLYNGFIKQILFNSSSKIDKIEGITGIKIVYSEDYYNKLDNVLFKQNGKNENITDNENTINFDNNLIKKYGLKVLMKYRYQLELIEEELKEKVNIYKIEGKWYFGEAKGIDNWPQINGKSLKNFPNGSFNKENNIGNVNGVLTNPNKLKNIFLILGFDIINKEEIKDYYKNQLEGIGEELKEKANIYKIFGKWYLLDSKGYVNWPQINGKSLKNFPNALFNKENNLGNSKGVINNSNQLKGLFEFLGMDVINDRIEILDYYKSELEGIEQELKREANIYKIKGKWCFLEAKGNNFWPQINGKSLMHFPNTKFNKENKMGNQNGLINSLQQLAQLFEFLGMDVIKTEKEIKNYYKSKLEGIEQELKEEANIYKIKGKWCFLEAKGTDNWPKLNGKSLSNFPDSFFNKKNNIGNINGIIKNSKELKKLFEILGMKVIKEEKEIIDYYKNQLERIEQELKEEANIYQIAGKWYFLEAKGNNYWPRINGKTLNIFPNKKFNKENNIGNRSGIINNVKHLQVLFEFLGMDIIK